MGWFDNAKSWFVQAAKDVAHTISNAAESAAPAVTTVYNDAKGGLGSLFGLVKDQQKGGRGHSWWLRKQSYQHYRWHIQGYCMASSNWSSSSWWRHPTQEVSMLIHQITN